MTLKIITSKLLSLKLSPEETIVHRRICTEYKARAVIKRLFTRSKDCIRKIWKLQKPHKGFNHCSPFTKDWFCKQCFTIFSLKPSKRYKTVKQYLLRCPKCGSKHTAHNFALSIAIAENMPVTELHKIAQAYGIEIEVELAGKPTYYPQIISKSTHNVEKEYFLLKEPETNGNYEFISVP